VLLLPVGSASSQAPDSEPDVSLPGSWYVLVHYTDPEELPGRVQWRDVVWRFAERGAKLEWTEYVRLEFRDATGRREQLEGGLEARTLGAWAPDEGQLREISRGLRVDGRGSRSKSLRGSPERGYSSSGGLRSESTSVIGYHERWQIAGTPTRPVFSRTDAMGSARTEDISGTTEYATDVVLDGGNELRGRYRREGWSGTFRMIRMAREAGGGKAP
jgi:hypothetical protein